MTRILLVAALLLVCGVTVASAQGTASSVSVELTVCTSITDRQPQGADSSFSASAGSLYAWCKVTGVTGESVVSHVWLHNGEEVRRVELPVRSSAWRTWSQKTLYGKTGAWEVRVLDSTGTTLASTTFTVTE